MGDIDKETKKSIIEPYLIHKTKRRMAFFCFVFLEQAVCMEFFGKLH